MLCVHVLNKCRLTKREREGERIENWDETKKDTRGQEETGRQRHKHKTGGERERDGQVRCKWGELRKKWIEQGLKTTEKTVWTESRADQKER